MKGISLCASCCDINIEAGRVEDISIFCSGFDLFRAWLDTACGCDCVGWIVDCKLRDDNNLELFSQEVGP